MSNSTDSWADVKARLKFTELLASEGYCATDHKPGRYVRCPFHAENTPSFAVWDDHGHCFGCGWHGDVFDFWKDLHGGEGFDALKALAERVGVTVQTSPEAQERAQKKRERSDRLRALAVEAWRTLWKQPAGEGPQRWLSDTRGLDLGVCRQAGLGYVPTQYQWKAWAEDLHDLASFLSGCIIFPHKQHGRISYVTSRGLEGKAHRKLRKDKWGDAPQVWWPSGPPRKSTQVLLVEGEIDGLSMFSLGADQKLEGPPGWLVGVLLGAGARAESVATEIAGDGPVVAILDADQAARDCTRRLGQEMPARLRVPVPHPAAEGYDLNDVLRANGPDYLRQSVTHALSSARPYVEVLIEAVADHCAGDQTVLAGMLRNEVVPALAKLAHENPIALDLHLETIRKKTKVRTGSLRLEIERAGLALTGPNGDGGGGDDEHQEFHSKRIPYGWRVEKNRLYRLRPGKKGSDDDAGKYLVLDCVPTITHRYLDDLTGDHSFEVKWVRRRRPRKLIVPAQQLASTNQILNLASQGLPVAGHVSKDAVRWFSDFERVNYERIKETTSTSRLGWHRERRVFLYGTDVLGDAEDVPRHTPLDQGEQQTAASLRAYGSSDEWFSVVLPKLQKYPYLALILAGTLAAPLVGLTNCGNFIIGIECSGSSIGKTLSMRVAESIWGNPGDGGLEKRFEATQVSLERYCAQLCDLPTFIDETQAHDPRVDIVKTLYIITDGQEKGRGSLQGQRRSRMWSGSTVITGETPVEDYRQLEGISARIIGINESPFRGRQEKDVGELEKLLQEHYGHAGRVFLRWLMAQNVWQERVLARYQDYRQMMGDTWSGHDTMNRRLGYAATITAAAHYAGQAWPWPESGPSFPEVVSEALNWAAETASQRDVARDAFQLLQSHIGANRTLLYTQRWAQEGLGEEVQNRSYIGVSFGDGTVGIFQTVVQELFKRHGYHWLAIMREWRQRGWLLRYSGRGFTWGVRVLDTRAPCIVVRVDQDTNAPETNEQQEIPE